MASSGTTFPLAQNGSWTHPSGVSGWCVTGARLATRHRLYRATGTCSGTQAKSHRWVRGVPIREFILRGQVGTNNAYALSQQSAITIGAGTSGGDVLTVRTTAFSLVKAWALYPATGSGTGSDTSPTPDLAESEWVWGIPEYRLSARGWATGAGGPVHTTQIASVSIDSDAMGVISWTTADAEMMVLDSLDVDVPLDTGGGVPVSFGGVMNGDVTYALGGDANDFSWLFIDPGAADDDPVKEEATLDTNGESIAHSVLVYYMRFDWDLNNGGPIRVQSRMRFDKA